MSNNQHQAFNLQFVKDVMNEWTISAINYDREAENAYKRLRSYLTLYQFRLSDNQKHEIREMLSQSLDEIEKIDLVEDMDNYLDGFCFKLDASVLPRAEKIKPSAVKIEIAPESVPRNKQEISQEGQSQYQPQPPQQQSRQQEMEPLPEIDHQILDNYIPVNIDNNAVDFTDFYQLQFFQ